VWDLLGIVPPATVHAKQYANLPQIAVAAYKEFISEVKERKYPLPEHGFSMDPEELAKFKDMVDKDVH
jgi:3-methyl-2-oxobutanoate hydroxymethyltransferase